MDCPYVELSCLSNFSFLEGASHPEELVAAAAAMGYHAVAVADRNTLAGVVRAHVAAREHGIRLVVGARVRFLTGEDLRRARLDVLLLPTDRASYGRLCRLLSVGKQRAGWGISSLERPRAQKAALEEDASSAACHLWLHDLLPLHHGLQAVVLPPPGTACMEQWFAEALAGMRRLFDGDRLSLAVWRLAEPDGELRVQQLRWLSADLDVPLLAVNDVHMHQPARRPLQEVLTCIRHGCTVQQAGRRLHAGAPRTLRPPAEMAARFRDLEEDAAARGVIGPVARSRVVAERCAGFSLDQVRYQYPAEVVPAGRTPPEHLRALVMEGARSRWPQGVPPAVSARLEAELTLIRELSYETYFLTVHDLVAFARSRGILCQGRGAAANSAVCYCLGITAVDPDRVDMLFERFISRERNEPPDIDVDFEHERREEVIQYVYARYGRERAAIAAEVICYRGRLAVRDVGKALGLSLDAVEKLASGVDWWHRDLGDAGRAERLRQLGLDPRDATLGHLFRLSAELLGFPRHLSQHVGGFVITEGPLCELVPVRNAGMEARTIIEWDKDDLDAMGMMKVDVLALGMLTCIRKAIQEVNLAVAAGMEAPAGPQPLHFHTIPAEEPRVYDMICRADTVGVFQVESRAQMSMLPRLRPRCYYDLVIEVAIVRPGPIQGDMVHPYLRRRNGEEPVLFPDETVRRVLGKTLGVPLFQEQAMSLAVVTAGFTPGQADQLRRAIAAWKRQGSRLAEFGTRLMEGMVARGYERRFAEQVFTQIQGFSGYGFPESHAASFALLVYASAWLKCHHPAAFAAAILNSQPMGFYAPAQLVQDAADHGVEVRPVDVNHSRWDCSLEPGGAGGTLGTRATRATRGPALRLGLRMVTGLAAADGEAIHAAVASHGPFRSVEGLWRASGVRVAVLRRLARADAFCSMGLPRQQALWQIRRLRDERAPLFELAEAESRSAEPSLPPVPAPRQVSMDYGATGLSLKAHPMSFLRQRLHERGASPCGWLRDEVRLPDRSAARVAGLVLVRQRPATAKGILFMTIEDESGPANLILRPRVYERYRRHARHSAVVMAEGRVERRHGVVHLLVRRVRSLDAWLAEAAVGSRSRDFH